MVARHVERVTEQGVQVKDLTLEEERQLVRERFVLVWYLHAGAFEDWATVYREEVTREVPAIPQAVLAAARQDAECREREEVIHGHALLMSRKPFYLKPFGRTRHDRTPR